MNKTRMFIATTMLFLLIDIVLLFRIEKDKTVIQQLQQKQHETSQISALKDMRVNVLEESIMLSLSSSGLTINSSLPIHNGNTTTPFGRAINAMPRLMLKYSELNCQTCIDVQLASLNGLAERIGRENIVLLASYKSTADMLRFKRLNKLNIDIYNTDSIGLPLEKANIPFYFIYDQDGVTKQVFVPSKEFPALTEKYFDLVVNRYFSKKDK